jgi:SagB-type dehydrogenase family enzyme
MKSIAIGLVCLAVFLGGVLYESKEIFGEENMARIDLPEPKHAGDVPVEEAIEKRRSERLLSPKELTLEQIGQLCWAAQGITEKSRGLRATPSAGALYPLELYLVTEKGVYHYLPKGHTLETVLKEDVRGRLAAAALNQDWFAHAPLIFVVTGVYKRTTAKYGARGRRYVDMEVGYVAQNIHLQAVALGLGSTSVGAFHDDKIARTIRAQSDEVPLILIPTGYVAK